MLTLESVLPPDPSRLRDWVVHSSLIEDLVDCCVADSALLVVVAEVSFDAAWPPIPRPSELEYEVHCGLWGSMDRVGFVGFDFTFTRYGMGTQDNNRFPARLSRSVQEWKEASFSSGSSKV